MITHELVMSKTEVKPITLHVVDLQSGETVAAATVTHTPPSGDAITIDPTVETPYVNMLFGPFDLAGWHFVMVQAEGSNGSKPVALYLIQVKDTGG
jgi:hypothetical protein